MAYLKSKIKLRKPHFDWLTCINEESSGLMTNFIGFLVHKESSGHHWEFFFEKIKESAKFEVQNSGEKLTGLSYYFVKKTMVIVAQTLSKSNFVKNEESVSKLFYQ